MRIFYHPDFCLFPCPVYSSSFRFFGPQMERVLDLIGTAVSQYTFIDIDPDIDIDINAYLSIPPRRMPLPVFRSFFGLTRSARQYHYVYP